MYEILHDVFSKWDIDEIGRFPFSMKLRKED